MPIWTGHQDPCAKKLLNVSSFKTAQALYQGRSNAKLATERATRAGIPPGSIIYYDLEPYAASCVIRKQKVNGNLVAKALLNGWIDELQFSEKIPGRRVYRRLEPERLQRAATGTKRRLGHKVDVPVGKVTIWDFEDEGLADSDPQFANDQRIHHYRSNTLER